MDINGNHGSKITVSQFHPQAAANIDFMLTFIDLTANDADFNGMFLRVCVLKLLRDYERICDMKDMVFKLNNYMFVPCFPWFCGFGVCQVPKHQALGENPVPCRSGMRKNTLINSTCGMYARAFRASRAFRAFSCGHGDRISAYLSC